MENKTYVIDLEDYRTPGSKLFFGRTLGQEVSQKSGINEKTKEYNKIIIKIPKEISSLNPSFLEEFIKKAVINLGKTKFLSKFSFECDGNYKIDNDLREAIDRILRENSVVEV